VVPVEVGAQMAGTCLRAHVSGAAGLQIIQVNAHKSACLPNTSISISTSMTALTGTESGRFSKRATIEIAAVSLTGAGHLGFRALDASQFFIPLASLGWATYVFQRARRDSTFLNDVGLRSAGIGGSFRDATIVAAGATAAMAGIAAAQGSLQLDSDILPLVVLYPAWGVVQQLLIQGMLTRNLKDAGGWSSSPHVVTPAAALLFGIVHLPNWKLTGATTALALAFTPI
jgi:hypothetical protein